MIIITIIAFLFILAFSVTIHEFGHFIIAKWTKIPVEKFSLGFGPPIYKKMIGETDFRIAVFPLGGYVKLQDEEEGEIIKSLKEITQPMPALGISTPENKPPGFYDVPVYRRIAVLISGPVFNIISALLLLIVIYNVYGLLETPFRTLSVEPGSAVERLGFQPGDSIISIDDTDISSWDDFLNRFEKGQNAHKISFMRQGTNQVLIVPRPQASIEFKVIIPPDIGQVRVSGPAYRAGIRKGDRVLRINQQEINTWDDMWQYIRKSYGQTLVFQYLRNQDTLTATVTPATVYDPIQKDTVGQIGILMKLVRRYPGFWPSISMAMNRGINIIWLTMKTLYELVIGKISRKNLGGPIAIARLSGESASWGLENLFSLLALISINLGLINLFPLPAFDGGQTLIALFEGIRRKKLSRRTRLIIQNIGYALILLLIIYVTYNDLTR